MESKICNKCGVDKPLTEFYSDRNKKRDDCKACRNKAEKEKKYRQEALKRFQEEGITKYIIIDENELKKPRECRMCGEVKTQRDFYYMKHRKRFYYECKICSNKKNKQKKQWRVQNENNV